MLEEQQL